LNIITKFKSMFIDKNEKVSKDNSSSEGIDIESNATSDFIEEVKPVQSEPVISEKDNPFSEPEPIIRRVIRVTAVSDNLFPPKDEKILIKAQPSTGGDQCLFMVNRPLFSGHSWWFPNFESAEGSPLAERLFSLDDVESVLVHESTLTITRKDKNIYDWKPFASEIGANLRDLLEEEGPLILDKIINEMPSQDVIQEGIQKAINEEVNPGVAGHGGLITLQNIKGNTITIQMGGGCQGCSSADLTLKQGIHSSFRKFVPQIGAIFDETDHAAGLNPYF
jgi:Fe-S cluster biogenesis protein NfuA